MGCTTLGRSDRFVHSCEALASAVRYACLQLLSECVVVDPSADQHKLVFAFAAPVGVIDGEAFAGEMEHVAPLAFLKPKNAFGTKHVLRHLVVEKILKPAQGEGAITLKRE